jgi:tetratricopeptide (TPR) repeat protein
MKFLKILIPLFFLSIIACKNDKPKPFPELASLNLLRGELLLCSSEQFGEVNFSLSCNYETRATFDLALSLLHSFEYAEAEKAFVKVIDADPTCAMAYWGVSMSIFHSLWMQADLSYLEKGKKLLEIAKSLPTSDREKDYIDAISVFYKNWDTTDITTRKLIYEKKMEDLYAKHKDDTEAAVFYALAIRAAADPNDKTYVKQKKSGKILEELFVEYPNHPGIAHYIIHNYDYPELAEMGLTTARRYAEIAPASAHAQHMPSHIFTRLGLWQESIDTNINSVSSAVCYAESINPDANWTAEIHAVDYLVYAHLQMGDNQKAAEQLKEMQAVKEVFPKDNFAATYALTAMPIRMALENKNWKEASTLELPSIDFPWKKLHWEKAIFHFGKALGYSHIGDIKSAEAELQILQTLHKNLLDANEVYKAGQVNIQFNSAQAWIELSKGNNDKALAHMKKAALLESKTSKHPVTPGEVLPADELLGDLLLALNKPVEALVAYEVNLKGHPNRFNGLYGAAIASKQSGNIEKAERYFNQLIEITKNANSDRLEIKEAQKYLNESKKAI